MTQSTVKIHYLDIFAIKRDKINTSITQKKNIDIYFISNICASAFYADIWCYVFVVTRQIRKLVINHSFAFCLERPLKELLGTHKSDTNRTWTFLAESKWYAITLRYVCFGCFSSPCLVLCQVFLFFFFATNARLLVTVPLRNHFFLFSLYVYVQ